MGQHSGEGVLEAGDHGFNEFTNATDPVLRARVAGDAFDRAILRADGAMQVGNGVAAPTLVNGQFAAVSPLDHGFAGWTGDPANLGASFVLTTAGTVYGTTFRVADTRTLTKAVVQVQTAGGTLTTGQCFLGLYSGTTLIGTSGDLAATTFVTTGIQVTGANSATITAATTGSLAVTAGQLISVVAFFNGTTGPALGVHGIATAIVGTATAGDAASPNFRNFTADTGRTTTLAATLGTQSALTHALWAAVI